MSKLLTLCFLTGSLPLFSGSGDLTENFTRGKADIQSFSSLTFGPEGILFVGDARGGQIFALDSEDKTANSSREAFNLEQVDVKIASFLGATREQVIIHDMAVNPISQNVYLAVSRNNAKALGYWKLPNDIGYANILIKITPQSAISEVPLDNINHSKVALPNAIGEGTKNWRGSDLRTETITDIEYANGKIFVAGLSNEEFASSLRVFNFPFNDQVASSTVEIWHAAHGKFETQSPIRTLLPYKINGEDHLLAAYTCTPLVSIPFSKIENGKHIKSKTLAELGSGNIPLDIITYQKEGKEKILIANSSRSLMRIDPEDLAKEPGLTKAVPDGYTAGVPYVPLSKISIVQIDKLNSDFILTLQLQPNGDLNLASYSNKWL